MNSWGASTDPSGPAGTPERTPWPPVLVAQVMRMVRPLEGAPAGFGVPWSAERDRSRAWH